MRNKKLVQDTIVAICCHFNCLGMTLEDHEGTFFRSKAVTRVVDQIAEVDECILSFYNNDTKVKTYGSYNGHIQFVNDDGAIVLNDCSSKYYDYLEEIGIMDKWDDVL